MSGVIIRLINTPSYLKLISSAIIKNEMDGNFYDAGAEYIAGNGNDKNFHGEVFWPEVTF